MTQKGAIIFCSASYDIDPKYNDAAREVVACLCHNGYAILSGGTVKGTMGVVAAEAEKHGAENIGVLPRFMEDVVYPTLTQTYWTDTMAERKELLRKLGKDMVIALPGGIGTLDELFETFTLAKLGKYGGKVIAYNFEGFYDNLKALLDFYVQKGMLDARTRGMIEFPGNVAELEKLL